MGKSVYSLQVSIAVVHYKFIWAIVKQFHHPAGTVKYHLAVSPCDGGCKKTCYLYIFFTGVLMRDADRIGLYEGGSVIQFNLFIKKLLKLMYIKLYFIILGEIKIRKAGK